jgi:hypothetical protein
VLGAGLLVLAGCTSSVSHYSLPSAPARPPQQHGPSSSSPAPAQSRLYDRCEARKKPGATPVVFYGTESQREYCGVIWRSEVASNCARYAYGARVIAFVRKHHCGKVHRELATIYVGDFVVNLSSVITNFNGASADGPYGNEYRFTQLAKSRKDGGIADLLRSGRVIPGPHGRAPAGAYYALFSLVYRVDLLDAWYVKRPAHIGFKNSLRELEQDVSFSRLTG